MNSKKDTTRHKITLDCPHCNKELDFDVLLSKYGPEGLYKIADKLKEVADQDVNEAMKQNSITPPKLPTTLSEAVEYLIPQFKGMDSYFKKNEDSFAAFCHSMFSGGIGMKIRNHLELWDENSTMHKHMREVHGCLHPDGMSDKILREIYRKVNSI